MGGFRAGGLTGLMNQPSAQVIDGSLRFDKSKTQFLEKTFASAGNRKTWTYSAWFKRGTTPSTNNIWAAYNGSFSGLDNFGQNYWDAADGRFVLYQNGGAQYTSAARHRDHSGWYHLVIACDVTKSSYADRYKVYVNNFLNTSSSGTITQDTNLAFNNNIKHYIGTHNGSGELLDGNLSQVYFIDGAALGPENFGFTDPLTNTWRPKKFDIKAQLAKNPNNGTTWSNSLTTNAGDNFDSSGAKTKAFDGNGSNKAYTDNDSDGTTQDTSYLEMVFPTAISGRLRVKCDNGNTVRNTTGGGNVLLATQGTGSDNQFVDCGTVSGLTNLRVLMSGGSRPAISMIELDGYVFIDGLSADNSFYLPLDGNSPIGQDKSGRGNDWTPSKIGGSNSIDKATGALPILEGAGGAVANVGVRTDAYASNLVLALPLVGSANDVSNRINSGTTSKTVTVNGAVASSSYSNFYGGSYYFDGSDNITVADGSNHFSFGTGAYTVEGYLYPTTLTGNGDANPRFFCCGTPSDSSNRNQLQIVITANGQIRLDTNSANYTSTAGDVVANRWQHIAVVRDGSGNLKAFVDGRQVLSQTNVNNDITNNDGISLGIEAGHSSRFTGYMNDVRIYKGVAKYNSNFIPASTNPDILPDTPSGVSGGSKLTKITDGAVSFEGTATSKLRVNDSTDFTFGTNDFCIEFYYYNNAFDSTYNILFDCVDTSRSGIQLAIEADNDYRIEVGDGAGNWIWQSTGFDAKVNKWTHFALTRQGNTFRAFEDGVLLGTQTSSTAVGDPRGPAIGGQAIDDSTNYGFNGFISNFRIVNNSPVYTAAFTPPTRTLTNITNTKLLCCQSNTSATEAAVIPTGSITANGGAAATNFNPFNTDINTVRGQETGYCTINPLDNPGEGPYGNQGATISNGNLDIAATGGSYAMRKGTLAVPSSGKFYYESTVNGSAASRSSSSQTSGIGLIKSNVITDGDAPITDNHTLWLGDSGYGKPFGSTTRVDWFGATIDQGDTLSFACDMDANTFEFKVNGVSAQSGNINTTEPVHPFVFSSGTSNTNLTLNFGQKPFKFPPPDGYQPLNAANVRPETVITRPDQYVGITTWSGNNVDGREIDMGMSPDLIWVKARNQTNWHWLTDTVRDAPNKLYSNSTNAEDTAPIYGQADSFTDKGWIAGGGTDGSNPLSDSNQTGTDYVCWGWKVGGNKNTFNVDDVGYASAAAAGLTAGNVTPSGASVGTKQGFSIIKFNSQSSDGNFTVPHGLNNTPNFILMKSQTRNGGPWWIYHSSTTTAVDLYLSFTTAATTDNIDAGGGNVWGSALPTSTTFGFTTGTGSAHTQNETVIAYVWHDVPGLQKFGGYTANGAEDGNFIELGFRPAILWIKATGSYSPGNWFCHDAARDTFNPTAGSLQLDSNNAEDTLGSGYYVDFLSNGFKLRANGNGENGASGYTYVYAAWAEAPAFNLYGGQSNAR